MVVVLILLLGIPYHLAPQYLKHMLIIDCTDIGLSVILSQFGVFSRKGAEIAIEEKVIFFFAASMYIYPVQIIYIHVGVS